MNYITMEHISKSFGEKVLFKDVTLRINKGDKIALIAKNGNGKSTLLKILAGEESAEGEKAKIDIIRDLRIGYLEQEPPLEGNKTIWENIVSSINPKVQAFKKYHAALDSGNAKAIEKTSLLMDDQKAWDVESTIFELFDKLKIGDFQRHVNLLSGGQKKRVALGMLLLEEPQLLILDEPTNHLDVEMVEWLETYLQQPDLALLMVTHDRYFLDRVCSEIIEIYNGNFYRYKGNYSDFLEKKTIFQETESSRLDKQQKLLKKELQWIRRMPQARTTKSKSRTDNFYELKAETAKQIYDDPMHVEIDMTRLGSKIVELRNVSLSFNVITDKGEKELVILKNFDYKFKKADRVGIVGPNGIGKSTFLKLITKQLRPNNGKVILGDTLKVGYYTQGGLLLEQDKRVIDVVRDIAEYLPLKGGFKLSAEMLLERFLFLRPQQQVYFSQLSGGEKRRLYLLTVLMGNPNFLILDEPTNDLDIMTLNVLEEFLLEFKGCLLIVSHDRYLIDKLVDHLFVFEGNGKIKDFPGSYTSYAQYKRVYDAELTKAKHNAPKANTAEVLTDNKIDYEKRKEIKRLEKSIEKMEEQKKKLQSKFTNPDLSLEEIQKLHGELKKMEGEIEVKEMEWMEKVG